MIQFTCPSCKQTLQTAPEHAGRTIDCPECQRRVAIPSSAITAGRTAERARSAYVPDERPRTRKRAPTKSAARGLGVGAIVLLVLGVGGCIGLVIVGALIALLIPALDKVQKAEQRMNAMNNLKEIGLAFHNHHDQFGFLPSAKVHQTDWRKGQAFPPETVELSCASLLPFLDEVDLFNQIDKNAAWHDPRNAFFEEDRPDAYDSFWRAGAKEQDDVELTLTHFKVFTGPNTVFPDSWTRPKMPAAFRDGTSNTLLVAEADEASVWLRPMDCQRRLGTWPLPRDGFLAAMADGSVRFIERRRVNDRILDLLINPQDGQALPPEAFD